MKSVLENKKKLLIIILVFVGIIFLVLGIYALTNNDLKNSGNNSINDNNNSNNNNLPQVDGNKNPIVEVNPTEVSTFKISNFEVKKNTPNEVNMVFKVVNESKEDIKGKTLDINMYNKDKLLYIYGYVIEDLKVGEYMYVQANAAFEYDKITKFEFQIDDSKVSIKPTYVD